MNAESFVKNEAKSILRNGNWIKAVVAVMVLCLVPLIGSLVASIAYGLASTDGDFSTDVLTSSPLIMVFFVLFQLIAVVAVVLLSPLMNGCVRMFFGMADGKEAGLSDIFYFFETKERYISSIKFMVGIIVKVLVITILFQIPTIIAYGISISAYHKNFARSEDLGIVNALSVVAVVLLVLGLIIAICTCMRYVFDVVLFSYYGCDEKQSKTIGAQVSKKHTMSLVKLTVSFIPWLLLLFFVVPFLYVFPYMMCAYSVSVKYLFNSYGLRFEDNTEVNSTQSFTANDISDSVVTEVKNDIEEYAYSDTTSPEDVPISESSADELASSESDGDKSEFSSGLEYNVTEFNGITFGSFKSDDRVGGDVQK